MIAERPFPCELVAIGDPNLVGERARRLGVALKVKRFDPRASPSVHRPGHLPVFPTKRAAATAPGQIDPGNAEYVLETVAEGARACLSGAFAALVTPPVHKGVINQAGFPFTGHTEFIAEITGGHPVMMLTIPGLRVALATTHLPLADVSRSLTGDLLRSVLRTLQRDLQSRFAIPEPRILVCGLNPHAGEGGHLGREEIDIIEPTIAALRREGFLLTGPLPADTAFLPRHLEHSDVVLAMYHDQGLPVLKHAGFGRAVNVTLGLPIIRTSVDHGTAIDLAGTGQADPGSLMMAVEMAIDMANRAHAQLP